MKRIGILALQGGVAEHLDMLAQFPQVSGIPIKSAHQLTSLDGLIIPGGESTTLGKLIRDFDLLHPLQEVITQGLPTWGTCAGAILLARSIANSHANHLGCMGITVKRNAYGSQKESFQTEAIIPDISPTPIPLIFIRAPIITDVEDDVKVLLTLNNQIVACKQNHLLATSFHPELTDCLAFHHYFLTQCLG